MKRPEYLGLIFLTCFALGPQPALATGDCSDYTDLSGLELPITVNGTTTGATADYGPFAEEPSCWQGTWDASCAASRDVTYKWTVPHDGLFTITLADSPGNSDLLVYRFTCPDEPLHPDDFLCGSHRGFGSCGTVRDIPLVAGQEIMIAVDGWLIWNGEFVLRISDTTTNSDTLAMGMDLEPFLGITATTVWGGTARWIDHLGLADTTGVLVGDNHLFPVASVSKTVTGTALMQLWEDGLFELDDAVDEYLLFPVRHPEYPEIPITFRMLMSHVTSIDDNWVQLNRVKREDGNDSPVTPCEFAEGYLVPDGPYYTFLSFIEGIPPGTEYHYSNVNATLIGCLVEQINPEGLTFEDFCREHIFDPLQMSSSSFLLANIDPDDLATNYVWDGQDYTEYGHRTAAWYPAMYLRTNAREMSRFLLAYIHGGELYGERILDSATIDTMFTIHYPDLAVIQGLVWFESSVGGVSGWGHGGAGGGIRARISLSPEQGVGAFAVTNSSDLADDYSVEAIVDLLASRALDDAAAAVAVPDANSAVPDLVQLEPCYPNPFNPLTSIRFELSDADDARLSIYDLRGRLITTLVNEAVAAGHHSITWDGRDTHGRDIPSGTYIVRLEAGAEMEARKVMLVR